MLCDVTNKLILFPGSMWERWGVVEGATLWWEKKLFWMLPGMLHNIPTA